MFSFGKMYYVKSNNEPLPSFKRMVVFAINNKKFLCLTHKGNIRKMDYVRMESPTSLNDKWVNVKGQSKTFTDRLKKNKHSSSEQLRFSYKQSKKKHYNYNNSYLNVGKLKKQLSNIPDNYPVVIQRIEDKYFEEDKGWSPTYCLDGSYFSEYLEAFTSRPSIDINSKNVYVINIHY